MDGNKLSKVEKGQITPDQPEKQVYESIRAALAEARRKVVAAANAAMVGVYHEIGRQINEAVGERAGYGRNLLTYLSERLTAEFGKGFTVRNLQQMRQFYNTFPNAHTLRAGLSWSHYRALMSRAAESST